MNPKDIYSKLQPCPANISWLSEYISSFLIGSRNNEQSDGMFIPDLAFKGVSLQDAAYSAV